MDDTPEPPVEGAEVEKQVAAMGESKMPADDLYIGPHERRYTPEEWETFKASVLKASEPEPIPDYATLVNKPD